MFFVTPAGPAPAGDCGSGFCCHTDSEVAVIEGKGTPNAHLLAVRPPYNHSCDTYGVLFADYQCKTYSDTYLQISGRLSSLRGCASYGEGSGMQSFMVNCCSRPTGHFLRAINPLRNQVDEFKEAVQVRVFGRDETFHPISSHLIRDNNLGYGSMLRRFVTILKSSSAQSKT